MVENTETPSRGRSQTMHSCEKFRSIVVQLVLFFKREEPLEPSFSFAKKSVKEDRYFGQPAVENRDDKNGQDCE